jgi:hypothetical protein
VQLKGEVMELQLTLRDLREAKQRRTKRNQDQRSTQRNLSYSSPRVTPPMEPNRVAERHDEPLPLFQIMNDRERRELKVMKLEADDRRDMIQEIRSQIDAYKSSDTFSNVQSQRPVIERLKSALSTEIESYSRLKYRVIGLKSLGFSMTDDEIEDTEEVRQAFKDLSAALSIKRRKQKQLARLEDRSRRVRLFERLFEGRLIEKLSTIFAGPFDGSVHDVDVRRLFSPFGQVKLLLTERTEADGGDFSVGIQMGSHEEAENALAALNGRDFHGRCLTVAWSTEELPLRIERSKSGLESFSFSS